MTSFFKIFFKSWGACPPDPPLKLFVALARTHKSLAGLKKCNQNLKKKWEKTCLNLIIEQLFFQFFFKSWGAGPPDPPWRNPSHQMEHKKVNTNYFGKQLGKKSQQHFSLKNQIIKSSEGFSVTYFFFSPANFLFSNWESQQSKTFMRNAVSYMYFKTTCSNFCKLFNKIIKITTKDRVGNTLILFILIKLCPYYLQMIIQNNYQALRISY